MFESIGVIVGNAVDIFRGVMEIVLTLCLGFGLISGPSTETPVEFQDAEECRMSFVALADTHVRDTKINNFYLESGLQDMANAKDEFDALVIAGDLSEFGDPYSYEVLWEKLDASVFADRAILLASGNHDIRLAYAKQTEMIMGKAEEYLGIEIDKPYYSYDVEGYTFVVLGSDKWQLEKAVISDEQLAFLDSELARGTKDGKPVFVICHQSLSNTHGLPEVWENGDLGEDSADVLDVLTKYENVFYLNGHLHDGIYENSLEVLNEEKGVYSINLPAYGRENDYGAFLQSGLGAYIEVYDDCVVFTARDFCAGENLEGMTYTFELK
ncbi:MAG: metallophosphoesterase [Clostridia bacterium]|nr:metallophosphoesterase [Clostridia bacterium]